MLQAVATPCAVMAQNTDIYAAIRKEGMENSKIMNTMHYFTDLYGPRLTGSPNHVNAAKWGVTEMKSWGFDNTYLEPWEFGHPGWVSERATGLMLSPVQDTLDIRGAGMDAVDKRCCYVPMRSISLFRNFRRRRIRR